LKLAVVDASVVLKWCLPEADSRLARSLTSRFLHAPDLLLVECANVFWRKVRVGDLTASQAEHVFRILSSAPVTLHETTPSLSARALEIALRLQHPAYDCVYLALALELKADQLITADERFASAAAAGPAKWGGIVCRLADA
jgi:predicted nucleic acid-binding protein